MFPLRDNIPSSRFPSATLGIIILNVLVFLHELRLGPQLGGLLEQYGVTPIRYTNTEVAHHFTLSEQLFAFVSSMFLHGGWIHLLGNMWSLWIFGDNVEDRLGRANYLLLYWAAAWRRRCCIFLPMPVRRCRPSGPAERSPV